MKRLPWRSAALVMLGALVGRALGIGRESAFAHYFGAGFLTDAYFVAVLIPLLVQNVVAGGSLQAAFVPMVADEAAQKGRAAANQMVADLAFLTTLGLTVVALALAVFAEPIIRITAGGFSVEAVAAGATTLRWCAVLVVLNGFLAVVLGALNTFGEFKTTATLSPLLNAVQIAAIVLLAPSFGIAAAVGGLLAGTVAQCAVQIVPLRRHGVQLSRPRLSLALWRRLLPGFVPAALASLVAQGNPLADKVIGSYLAAGSISYLNYSEPVRRQCGDRDDQRGAGDVSDDVYRAGRGGPGGRSGRPAAGRSRHPAHRGAGSIPARRLRAGRSTRGLRLGSPVAR